MRIIKFEILLLVLLFALFTSTCKFKNSESTKSEFFYFGQTPPGLIPELFAPGIVSLEGRYEHGISFSPELDELYFSANIEDKVPDIFFSKQEAGKWTEPQKAAFTKGEKDAEMHPFVNFTNDKIFFTAHNADYSDTKVWVVERLRDSWSKALKMESPINDDEVFYLNQSKNADFFYTNVSKRKMYYSHTKNGEYPSTKELEIEFGFHGFISPSEDYIVVNAQNREDEQRKDNDLYVYFKNNDGTWSKAIKLGAAVNSSFDETCPSITPDGKFLFFSRYDEEGGMSNFYWVSTEHVHNIRPEVHVVSER